MRITHILVWGLLSLTIAACSGIEIKQAPTDQFAAGNYRYYKWRTQPLQNSGNSSDPLYAMDPIVRKQVDLGLQNKGYVLDEERAQFNVDYLYATGMRQGAESEQASNISPYPSVTPNRQVDQASVDNAIALGGVKETSNIVLQFNDATSNEEVWQATMTKIVENVNNSVDTSRLADNLGQYLEKALKPLPEAAHP